MIPNDAMDVDFYVIRPFGSAPTGIETRYSGRLSKHCWKRPRRASRHFGYGDLRLHHRTSFYYTQCLYVPCLVDIRDGMTRATQSEDFIIADGDEIRINTRSGPSYTVVMVSIIRHGYLCWKKIYLFRDDPAWGVSGPDVCPCAECEIPVNLYATVTVLSDDGPACQIEGMYDLALKEDCIAPMIWEGIKSPASCANSDPSSDCDEPVLHMSCAGTPPFEIGSIGIGYGCGGTGSVSIFATVNTVNCTPFEATGAWLDAMLNPWATVTVTE